MAQPLGLPPSSATTVDGPVGGDPGQALADQLGRRARRRPAGPPAPRGTRRPSARIRASRTRPRLRLAAGGEELVELLGGHQHVAGLGALGRADDAAAARAGP